jgi:uncharacterized protein (TIRG00374 family)
LLSERARRFRWTLLRIAVSVILLTLLLQRITLAELSEAFARGLANWPLLLLAFALPLVGLTLAAGRWQKLMVVQGDHIPLRRYLTAMLVGAFYNQTLPSTVGGDLARGVWMTERGESPLVNLAVVTLDRAIGVFSLVLLALFCALASPAVRQIVPALWVVPASLAALALVLGLLASRHARALGDRLFSRGLLQQYRDKAVLVFDTLRAYRDQKAVLFLAVLLSVALQLAIVFQVLVLATALDLQVPMWELALIVPVVTLVSMLPVTVNGLGLREGTFAVLGASFGISTADAVALGWLTVAIAVGYGIWGGILHLRGRDRREPVEESS